MIRLSKSCISSTEKQAVMEVLDREYLGMGDEVQQFEAQLTEFFGRPAVCVANGTAALQLALEAVGIGVGDEVLVQSLTYVASFQAISATGARAVSCEVDTQTLTLDLNDLEGRLSEKTKAIMPVHYAGDVGALDQIYQFAQAKGLRVIEDAAHAFGSVYKGQKVGGFGDISCFSFDGIKNITSGEGGCIVTDNDAILDYVKDARLLGVMRDSDQRAEGKRSWSFDVVNQGWRYHMSNIMAAIGMEQLARFPEFRERRQSLAVHYDKLFTGHSAIHPFHRDYGAIVPHIYVVRISSLKERRELRDRLLEEGVETGVHYQPNHQLSRYGVHEVNELPITDGVFPELLTLPLHPDMEFSDVEYVAEKLMELVESGK